MFNSQAPNPDDLPSSAQLLKSTVISAVAAGAILVTVVLPSEYAIDPTGIGSALGLTAMGEIKTQLAEEAEMDRQASENQSNPVIQSGQRSQPAATPMEGSSLVDRIIREFGVSAAYAQTAERQDEMSITLQPGEGAEVKLVMTKGAKANYTWTANGSKVNFDTHGDGDGENISYEKGRGAAEDSGVLEAAFTGNHGWFWRNRTNDPVTVTLKTDGAYSDIKRMM
ncbi:transmembrane anchor protein [Agrobacterium genomosp. 3 str. CIP 111-78]|uniref:Transmembrane anchor protein n=1 Tax=Agrobacterium tumefaciens TaxID=358 RepID=A0AAE6EJT3_AGRTU|nr:MULTISPECIES: transmembrane anchor protein [Agrobacterium tumefaciens complex]MCA2374611.1 transmembrane anchor protein [Agrobacterium tomkonis CIP 111-78]QCM00032.1 transmembrane anchor protein [Agrobacterium tumefaciens]